MQDVRALCLGEKTTAKLLEILGTGQLQRNEERRGSERVQAMTLFCRYGSAIIGFNCNCGWGLAMHVSMCARLSPSTIAIHTDTRIECHTHHVT